MASVSPSGAVLGVTVELAAGKEHPTADQASDQSDGPEFAAQAILFDDVDGPADCRSH